ncbi:PadR family transcriptional regulator [Agromyces sp. NPDC058484]|uniref:PadR family transcriptional regulator n=1 Tax=Agromyces sp. NPDC058484 TaxID=3346524 RepID=UPI0036631445
MAVRDAILVLLTAGPAYGFQLHGGLAARTGGRRTVNVGQTYATLERLARQRLVEPAGTTDDGLPLHRLTAAGAEAAQAWLMGADAAGADPWDETLDRILIARSLPDCDADAVIAAERARWRERRAAASAAVAASDTVAASAEASDSTTTAVPPANGMPASDEARTDASEASLVGLAASAELARADAALAWLGTVEAETRLPFPPRTSRPKRGRRPGAATAKGDPQASAIA